MRQGQLIQVGDHVEVWCTDESGLDWQRIVHVVFALGERRGEQWFRVRFDDGELWDCPDSALDSL